MSSSGVLIVGVGGQGVLLASEVLAAVCLSQGLAVKKSEVHGMAQRGGIVYSHVRYGPQVHSPLIEEGQGDVLVSLEWAEALRWSSFLRAGGAVIVDAAQVVPPAACGDRRTWASVYPPLDLAPFRASGHEVYLVEARALAKAAGVARAANVVLLGTLSTRLEFSPDTWEAAIRRLVPAASVEGNLRAFEAGRSVEPVRAVDRGAPHVPRRREQRRFHLDIVEAWCKGCDICVRICPEDCLRLDAAGIVRVAAPEACSGCRLCEWLCPDFAITVREQKVRVGG